MVKWEAEVAIDFANALFDAAKIAEETSQICYITKVGRFHVATDCIADDYVVCQVDPPTEKPDQVPKVA